MQGVGRERMFNIVKRRDFVLADDLPSIQEAEQLLEKYGLDYIVVSRVDTEPGQDPKAPAVSRS